MSRQTIDIADLEAGIDRKALSQLRERFIAVNQGRRERWLAQLTDRQRQFVTLLPLILQVNHPLLPGYVSATAPAGLHGYKPEDQALHLAVSMARSFRFQSRREPADIRALFAMGSCGTIAHSAGSDMDFWVCVRDDLDEAARAVLERKLSLLSDWGRSQGVAAHCFIMSPAAFRQGNRAGLSAEDCGSTQHLLLLDEFYRSALWLAGAWPLWWLVPAEREPDYVDFAHSLCHRRYIKAEDYVDFGGLGHIPASEFVGAGAWQLYKGIEAPYKSVLKILLVEVYASAFPAVDCLSLEQKRLVYAQRPTLDAVDPYLLLFRRVEAYLAARGEAERLQLARECFYFKVNEPVSASRAKVAWKREVMLALVAEWGWDSQRLRRLDQREHWKIGATQAAHQQLVAELSHSYRVLTSFARAHAGAELSPRTRDEVELLGRKLHAAVERRAGKIERINPAIAHDLAEAELFLSREQADSGAWLLALAGYDGKPLQPALKRSNSLIELLAWTWLNGLVGPGSQWRLQGQGPLTAKAVHEVVLQLRQHLSGRAGYADDDALAQPALPDIVLLFVNVGHDLTRPAGKPGYQRLSAANNALAYGGVHENLVLGVDVLVLNSWHELTVRHYEGDGAFATAAAMLVNAALPGAPAYRPKVEVFCPSGQYAAAIRQRLTALLGQLFDCFLGATAGAARYLFAIADTYWLLVLRERQLGARAATDEAGLFSLLGEPLPGVAPLVIDAQALPDSPLPLLVRVHKPHCLVIGLEPQPGGESLRLWLLDEHQALYCRALPAAPLPVLLVPLRRFLRAVMERRKAAAAALALPAVSDPELRSLLLSRSGNRWQAEACAIPAGYQERRFLNVQAVVQRLDGQEQFTVFCEGREFTEQEYGDQLYDAVARYVRSFRGAGGYYPVHVTDLDLSELPAPGGVHATVTYLRYREQLEDALSTALRDLKG